MNNRNTLKYSRVTVIRQTLRVVDPTGAAYGNLVDFTPTQTVSEDANWKSTVAVRAALKYAPTDNLTFAPSIFYQKQHVNDSPDASYWLSQSDLNTRSYSRPYYFAGDPLTDPSVTALSGPGRPGAGGCRSCRPDRPDPGTRNLVQGKTGLRGQQAREVTPRASLCAD
jgi:hypothetical protein